METKRYKFYLFLTLLLICLICIFFGIYKSIDVSSKSNKQIKLMVELDSDAYIDIKDSNPNISEDDILDNQTDIINQAEDITHNKVNNRYSYLVNGFSISGKYEDIDKLKNIDGVKDVYESVKLIQSDESSNSINNITDNMLSKYGYTGKGTVISIIDTGMDLNNENMKNIDNSNLKLSKDDIQDVISQTGRGMYVSDKIPYAYNYADGDLNIINTSEVHGMHVAGIAAANGEEYSGVSKNTQILAMKVKSSTDGGFYSEDLLLAIEDSVKLKADIINMSYGSDASVKSDDSLYKKAIDKAASLGILCVNSAGNSGVATAKSKNSYPSNYSGIKDTSIVDNSSDVTLTVASMNKYNEMSNFSSWGPSASLELKPEITALGEDVRSTVNDNKFAYLSGTSMAAPYVSGAEALIYEYINTNFKDISPDSKASLAKNLAMNTADILYEDDIPYSPRRQGAGAININRALKNSVTVTDDRGKASIALKNIGKEKDFNIVVTNYGDTDACYSLNEKEKLYSETVLDNKKIREIEIPNACITFDQSSITIKAHSFQVIKAKLCLPDSFEINNFVEGYIKLSSIEQTKSDLNVPVLAFYGDYGNETILDYPIYDSRSIFKTTGLGSISGGKFNYYGEYTDQNGEKKVDANLVAFSPNNDANQDRVSLWTYFLRNSKYYEIEVLDKDKKFVGNKVVYNNVVKNKYYDPSGNKDRQWQYYYNWDGTKYDMLTGKSVVVDDGLYYIRVKTAGYTENAKEQIIDMPVKIDTTPPVLDDVNIDKNEKDGEIKYTLRWQARDNYSGIKNQAEYILNDNSNNVHDLDDIHSDCDLYSSDIELNKGQINKITLKVYDYAGNEKTTDLFYDAKDDDKSATGNEDQNPGEKPGMVEALSFSKLKDGLCINVGSGKFKIKGYARDDVSNILINDSEVSLSDGYFEGVAILNSGNNTVNVKAQNKDGDIIFDKDYNVILDKDKPELISVSPDAMHRVYAIEDNEYEMHIKASDMTKITCEISNKLTSDDESFELDENGEGDISIPLDNGLNNLSVTLSDEANNFSDTYELLVVKVSDINELNVGFVNIENSQSSAGNVDEEGCIEVIGYVTKKPKVLKINDVDVNINDDFTVNQKVKLQEGLNKIKIYAEDENGKVVEEYAYRLYYDEEAPIISLDIPIKNYSDGTFYTNSQNFTLKGYVQDNDSDYKVYLNGNMIINTQVGIVGPEDDSLKRYFNYEYILFKGDNYFKFRTVDKFGNDKVEIVKIVCIPPIDAVLQPGGIVQYDNFDEVEPLDKTESNTSDNNSVFFIIGCIILSMNFILKNINKNIYNY